MAIKPSSPKKPSQPSRKQPPRKAKKQPSQPARKQTSRKKLSKQPSQPTPKQTSRKKPPKQPTDFSSVEVNPALRKVTASENPLAWAFVRVWDEMQRRKRENVQSDAAQEYLNLHGSSYLEPWEICIGSCCHGGARGNSLL